MVRLGGVVLLSVILTQSTQARAHEQSCVQSAIDAYLKNEETGRSFSESKRPDRSGLLPRQSSCPSMRLSGALEAISSYISVPVDRASNAILVDTEQCGGGNKHGQYLVIFRSGSCEVVREPEVGDMKFIAEKMYAIDGRIILNGRKWMPDDAHCCPSKNGILDYNIFTGSYSFKLSPQKD